MEIDQEFLVMKKEQFAQPFPAYDVLGWYVTKAKLTAADFEINVQFQDVNESPLILVLDPTKVMRCSAAHAAASHIATPPPSRPLRRPSGFPLTFTSKRSAWWMACPNPSSRT